MWYEDVQHILLTTTFTGPSNLVYASALPSSAVPGGRPTSGTALAEWAPGAGPRPLGPTTWDSKRFCLSLVRLLSHIIILQKLMYGFSEFLHFPIFMTQVCRQIYHTWSMWVLSPSLVESWLESWCTKWWMARKFRNAYITKKSRSPSKLGIM